jgi:DNA-directed RNA polymerase subunit RPC12/RpoP
MNITYQCSKCHQVQRVEFDESTEQLDCFNCEHQVNVPKEAVVEKHVKKCMVCPSTELFVRKDFSQRIGVTIVVLGFVFSTIAYFNYYLILSFGIMLVTAAIDALLYVIMGESLTCYRCSSEYRGTEDIESHGGFDLEVHEKHRQEVARIKEHSQTD